MSKLGNLIARFNRRAERVGAAAAVQQTGGASTAGGASVNAVGVEAAAGEIRADTAEREGEEPAR